MDTKAERHIRELKSYINTRLAAMKSEINRRFADIKSEIDRRFAELQSQIDRRFAEIDRRFVEVNKRLDKHDEILLGITARLDNIEVVRRNGRLLRMHQPINPIKRLKPSDSEYEPGEFVWKSHPKVPKHMFDLYRLGQRAKGLLTTEGSSRMSTQQGELRYILYRQSSSQN